MRDAGLEDEQRDRDRQDAVAERFQPAEGQLFRHALHLLRATLRPRPQSLEFDRMAIAREAEPVSSLHEIREAGLDREDLLTIYRTMLMRAGSRRGHILYKQGKIRLVLHGARQRGLGDRRRDGDGSTTWGRRSTATWACMHARRRALADLRPVHGARGRADSRPGRQRPHGRLEARPPRHGQYPRCCLLRSAVRSPSGSARSASPSAGSAKAHPRAVTRTRMNLAGVRLPAVVFICDNNQWAYSTPTHLEYACETLADRAQAYGFEEVVVDGTDVSPSTARRSARSRRRAKAGPDADRIHDAPDGGHRAATTFYVPKEMFEEWAKRDPIERFRSWLRENAELTDTEEEEIGASVKLLSDASTARTSHRCPIRPKLTEGVFATPEDLTRPTTNGWLSGGSWCVPRPRRREPSRYNWPQVGREMTYLQAISDGLRGEMRRDKRVFVIGEDVGVYGGAFKVTLGFQEEFGAWRVIDSPLSETAIVAGCTGAAIIGMRPSPRCSSRTSSPARTTSSRSPPSSATARGRRSRSSSGFLRRRVLGRPVPLAESGELVRAHRGPQGRLPCDAGGREGLLITAIEDPNPVLYFEHKHLYRRIKADVPEERYTVPFGKARAPEGDDVTVVTWGAMVYTADDAAKELEADGVSVEILDLRTIVPWDKKAVLESAQKTSKVLVLHEDTRTGGFGGEIAATIAEEAFEHLDAPIKRIAAPDTPVPSRRRSRRRSSRRWKTWPQDCETWLSTRPQELSPCILCQRKLDA